MGMDQYFTAGAPWPEKRETVAELRECRALNYEIKHHLRDRVYLHGDFKSGEVIRLFTMGGLFKKSFKTVRKWHLLTPLRPPVYQCRNCQARFR